MPRIGIDANYMSGEVRCIYLGSFIQFFLSRYFKGRCKKFGNLGSNNFIVWGAFFKVKSNFSSFTESKS